MILDNVVEFKNGKFLSKSEFNDRGLCPVYGSNGIIGRTNKYLYDDKLIIIGRMGSCGEVNICKEKAWIIDNTVILRPIVSKIDFNYLVFFLRTATSKIKKSGTSQPLITQTQIRNVSIPVPSLGTQRKIASILDKCESARTKRKEANRLTDEFLKFVFLEMFGDPLRNPKNLKVVVLLNVAKITMGQSPPFSTYNEHRNGLPFYQGKAEFGEVYPLVKKWCSEPQRCAQKNDVLMSVRAPVGPTNLAPTDCCIGRGLCAISGREINHLFLFYQLRLMEPAILSRQQGSTFGAIRREDVERTKVIYPEKELQQKFADIVQKVEKLKEKQRESEKELDNLFNSLMQRVFNGKLRGHNT